MTSADFSRQTFYDRHSHFNNQCIKPFVIVVRETSRGKIYNFPRLLT